MEPHEAAFLAALVAGPSRFHPLRDPESALTLRNLVLGQMAKAGFVAESQARDRMARAREVRSSLGECPEDQP